MEGVFMSFSHHWFCFCRYTGNACEQCVAGFYPHASWCVPQFITGRTIFDRFVDEEQQQKKFAGTIFLVIGGIAAACALASLSWVLYRWLVLGHTPKAALVLQRLLRGTQAAGKPGTSQKYLLDDELELSTGPMRGTRPVIEDASVWSKVRSVGHASRICESEILLHDLVELKLMRTRPKRLLHLTT